MHPIQSIILGIVQGLTEFLPVSSSAHLVLIPKFFDWADSGLAFDVALHMGTLSAILIYYWKDWVALLNQFLVHFGARKMANAIETTDWRLIILGCIPAGLAGLAFEKQAEETFRSPYIIACTLALFACLLWYADRKGGKKLSISSLALKQALIIGCAQALAIVPGVSRSGVTVTAALMLGFNNVAALRFSFLLSAPIVAGAGFMKMDAILKMVSGGGDQMNAVLLGFTSSLLSGLAAMWMLTAIARSKNFTPFVIYRLILSFVIILVFVVR